MKAPSPKDPSTIHAMVVIRRVLQFVRPYRGLVAISLLLNLLFSVFSAMVIGIISPVLETLYRGTTSSAASPVSGGMAPTALVSTWSAKFDEFRQTIVSHIVTDDLFTSIRNLSIALFLLFLGRGIAKYLSSVVSTRFEEGIMKSIRDALFRRVSGLSMDYFGKRRSGDIISLLTNDVGVLNGATISGVTIMWRELAQVIIHLVVLLLISPKLTAIALVVSLGGLAMIRLTTNYLRKYGRRMQASQADYTSTLQETVLGIRVVKAMGLESFAIRTFTAQTAQYVRSALKNTRITALVPVFNDTFGILALVTVFYLGGMELAAGNLTPTNLMLFLFFLFGLMQPIAVITGTIAGMQRGIVAASNVIATLDEAPTIVSGSTALPVFTNAIEVRNVSFAYGIEPVLRNVSFSIRKGETIAFVGSSGSGKSTMLDLLLRFYDAQQGSILLDGVDIKSLDIDDYRRMYGTVAQETILFNDTVANNISIGEPGAERSVVREAARIAHADTFISSMPEGYDTNIGDRGMKLSGGQRQRVAIARALYRKPQILLFDEATSALDSESERIVQDAINDVLRDRTAVLVAHRLSTIIHADRILVFDHGQIVEEGTHQELLARGGVYRSLYDMQYTSVGA